MSNILSVGVFFISILLTFLIYEHEGSWLSPFSFFSLLSSFVFGFSTILAPDYYFSPIALLYISSLIITYFLGGAIPLLKKESCNNRCDKIKIEVSNKSLVLISILGVFTGSISVIALLNTCGINITSIVSIKALLKGSLLLSKQRNDGVALPIQVTFCLGLNYCSLVYSGILSCKGKKKVQKIVSTLPLLPPLLFTILETARTIFLWALIIYICSYLSYRVKIKLDKFILFTKKKIALSVISIILVFLLFLATQMFRYNSINMNDLKKIQYIAMHLRIWFMGNLSGFCVWFDSFSFDNGLSIGQYTFGGVYEIITGHKRILGAFPEYVYISEDGDKTNIYTLFRAAIEDYTIYGTYIISVSLGFVSRIIYNKCQNGNFTSVIIFSAMLAEFLWAYIFSIFYYNIILLAYIFALGLLYVLNLKYIIATLVFKKQKK